MKIDIKYPIEIKKALKKIEDNGYKAYLVGGVVRDYFLNREANDYDVITNLSKEGIKKLFKPDDNSKYPYCFSLNTKFDTLVVLLSENIKMEISSFKNKNDDIKSDLLKRDFTINSLAVDCNNNLYNYSSAIEDIKNKVLRFNSDAEYIIKEDPSRILRYFKFLARLDFKEDEESLKAIYRNKELIKTVSVEKINICFKEILIYNPTLIKLMDKVGLIEILYPDLYRLKEIKQHSKYHYENAFDHTMTALSYSKKDTELKDEQKYIINYALLLHDIGKHDTVSIDEKGYEHYIGHPLDSYYKSINILKHYKISKKETELILLLIKNHDIELNGTRRCFNRLVNKYQIDSKEKLYFLYKVKIFDRLAHKEGFNDTKNINETYDKLISYYNEFENKIISILDLKISGKEIMRILNITPSKKIKEIKEELLKQVLCGTLKNENRELITYVTNKYKSKN